MAFGSTAIEVSTSDRSEVLCPAIDMLPLPNGPASSADPNLANYTSTATDRLLSTTFRSDFYKGGAMNVSGKQFAWVLSVFLCVSGSTVAQLDNASILGTVFDSSGAAIPGAKVSIQNMGTSATVEIVTDANGNFVAPVLPVGTY